MAELRVAISEALGPAYRVEREVRPVGDCRLFVARPEAAGPISELLVKVLPAALSLSVDESRLAQEVTLLAGQLVHDGLVLPHGAGRAGSFVYHTRPFVAGTTLRAWLRNNRTVPLARAVTILRDLLGALARAHAAHVAHGDLRPEHVLLTAGATMIADAGIVGAVGRSLTPEAPATARAALCGAAYQAGELPPDSLRNDMFGVAVMAQEMLTGRVAAPDMEPLEGRVLPPWVAGVLAARWTEAGEALAAYDL